MTLLTFIVASLATWRLSYMFVREKGPLDIFVKLRAFLGRIQSRSGGLFDLMSCVRCFSVWIGLVGALFVSHSFIQWLGYGLAFSAVASLIDILLSKKPNTFPVVTPPTRNNKVLVGRSATPVKRDDVIRNPDPRYGSVAVKASTLLDN